MDDDLPETGRRPNFIVLCGPNGSGKSTLFERRLAKWALPFINPDVIAKRIAPSDPENAALRATQIAEGQRRKLLEARASFITEGIRPDPKLLIEAKTRGYFTRVIFICLKSPDVNVTRVGIRISQGGHSVPEGAIVARYERALKSLPEAASIADQLILVDNTNTLRPHRFIARFSKGKLAKLRAATPAWADHVFAKEFAEFRAARLQR